MPGLTGRFYRKKPCGIIHKREKSWVSLKGIKKRPKESIRLTNKPTLFLIIGIPEKTFKLIKVS